MKAGVKLDELNKDKQTILFPAVIDCDLNLVKFLFQHQIDLNVRDIRGVSAQFYLNRSLNDPGTQPEIKNKIFQIFRIFQGDSTLSDLFYLESDESWMNLN